MLSKRYESTEVDRRTLLHVPSGTHLSTSSDNHQVVEIKIQLSVHTMHITINDLNLLGILKVLRLMFLDLNTFWLRNFDHDIYTIFKSD